MNLKPVPASTLFPAFLFVFATLVCAVAPAQQDLTRSPSERTGEDPATGLDQGSLVAGNLGGSGSLVGAGSVLMIQGRSVSGWMRLFSLPLLGLGIDTDFLARHGYESWHSEILDRIADVEATAITYRSEGVRGEPETQSGMLYLPADHRSADRPLTWIVYTKGTELKRLNVPSRHAGAESRIGAMIASLGYAVWMPDYPGMGLAPGIQTYCDPGSLARSSLDGLAAARTFLASSAGAAGGNGSVAENGGAGESGGVGRAAAAGGARAAGESGRLYVMGYSEGGLAAMSVARAVTEGAGWRETGGAALPAGLSLAGVYSMGAPLDIARGFRGEMAAGSHLANPAYTLFLLAGFARAHPDRVDLHRILRADIRESIIPLLGTDKSAEDINKMIATMRKKPVRELVASDILEMDFIEGLRRDHASDPLFQVLEEARMDRWTPDPALPLTLAASRNDGLVRFENSAEAMRWFSARRPAGGAELRLLVLASDSHTKAAVEALLFAIMDIDRAEAAMPDSGRTPATSVPAIRQSPER